LLCRCGCHSACALAGRLPPVSRVIWVGLCTCPGTELAEEKLDEAQREVPDFARLEYLARERQEQRAREHQAERAELREAREATRAAATGKSRAQIRLIYVAELRARGLSVPSDLELEAIADAIARGRENVSVAYSARLLAQLGREFGKLLSKFGSDA
jgi:hypothetical protein